MIRQAFVFLCLFSLPAIASAESESWKETIQSASQAHESGHYQEAKKLFAQAVEESEAFPSKDLRRVETNIKLAGTLLELGEYLECEQICLKSLKFLKQQHSEERLDAARAELVLAKLYFNVCLHELSEVHRTLGFNLRESDQRTGAPELAEFQTLRGYGTSRRDFSEVQRTVSIAEAKLGKQHPRYAKCLAMLATVYRQQREFAQSEKFSKQAIQILTKSLGQDHPELAAPLENLAWIERSQGHTAEASDLFRESIRQRFSTLSDADLCYFFDRFLETEQPMNHNDHEIMELYLTEMARRGEKVIEDHLAKIINEMQHNRQMAKRMLDNLERVTETDEDLWDKTQDRWERESDNLEILTALRRVQQKHDPLQIFIKEHDKEVSCIFPELPVLEAAIRNVDAEQREVGFTEGGNYRSGRQARWRIEVTDDKGRMYEPHQLTGLMIGGGQYRPSTLKAGEGWQTSLAMESFVDTLPPGEYQMRILYHNQITIVNSEFTAGLIVSRSNPIKLIVKPRQITVTKEQQKIINDTLPQLDAKLPVKIVSGKYGPWAHEFIKPDSQYGRLLALDWSVVPSLLDELIPEKQTPERRAHLLALLYSITGENHPTGERRGLVIMDESNALGNYSFIDTGWSVWGKREGEDGGGGGLGFNSDPSERKGKLDPKKQEPFVKNWAKFSRDLEVVHED